MRGLVRSCRRRHKQDLARGIGLDNRIGSKFLHPGPGYGGSCFPKDTIAFVHTARDANSPVSLIETVVNANAKRKQRMADKVIKAVGGSVEGKRIAILGLTFKPNTDDMRDAPSLEIIPALQRAGASVVAYDPQGVRTARSLLPGVEFAPDVYSCVTGAHAVAIITEWEMFRALDLPRIKSLLITPNMVDLRNIYRPRDMRAMGFAYAGVGIRASEPFATATALTHEFAGRCRRQAAYPVVTGSSVSALGLAAP
jgi:UDPglucose 6-dehydrogenase